MSAQTISWLDEPEHHDYAAAAAYLSLLFDEDSVAKAVKRLKKAEITTRKAKDILRASGLTALPEDNPHVQADLNKAQSGEKLSPILLVRAKGKLQIADGFHRACASYWSSEDTNVRCALVDL